MKNASQKLERIIRKRLEALERAADKEIFAEVWLDIAIAYHLGGAKRGSNIMEAYARALGYQDLRRLYRAQADLLCQPTDSVTVARSSDLRERTDRARVKLLAKFTYDPRRSAAALGDVQDRIMSSLPAEWLAPIRVKLRAPRAADAKTGPLFKQLVELAIAEQRESTCQTNPRER